MIAFHGTSKEAVDSILTLGFRPGTYFAHHMEDAAFFGGPFIFAVEFSDDPSMWSGEADGWQFHTRNWIGNNQIKKFLSITELDRKLLT